MNLCPSALPGRSALEANYGITGGASATNGFALRPVGVNSQAAGVRDAAFTQIANQAGVSSNSSNIGFRGSEDLGGGLKAIFQVESNVFVDGAGTTSGFWASRNSNVGLAGNWGTVFYGNWDTPYKFITLKVDPFWATSAASFNGLYGSPGFNVGSPTASTATLTGATLTTLGTDAAFDRRQGNSVQYWTPNFAGFSGRLFYSPGEGKQNYALDATAVTGPRTAQLDPWMWGASLQYDNGPIYAALGVRAAQGLLRHPRADRFHGVRHEFGRLGREDHPRCAESLGLQPLRLLRAAGIPDRRSGDPGSGSGCQA